jgi:uncharacterized protein
MARYRCFDADGHVFEREEEIFEYLRPPFQGHRELLRRDMFPPRDLWNRTALSLAGGYREGSTSGRQGDGGEQATVEQWLEMLDRLDLEGTVVYATSAQGASRVRQREWALALCQAYNDWLYDRYLSKTPRIKGMAVIPAQFPEDAAAELRRAVNELGMVGGIIAAAGRVALGDPMYDPIYQTAQELDTVVAIHAGGPGNRLEMLDRAIEQRCLGHPTSLMIEMVSMMFGGVFDRFPQTRFSFMEGGIAWALFTLERMQEAYEQWAVQAPELKRAPKEHLTSGRIYFHCEADEEILPYAVQVLGDHTLLYASDYPHIAPAKIQHHLVEFQARTDLSEESKQRILGDNARQLYKIGELAAAPA